MPRGACLWWMKNNSASLLRSQSRSSSSEVTLALGQEVSPKLAVDDDSLADLSVRSFSLNTDKKVQWVCDLYQDWWYIRCREVTCDSRIVGKFGVSQNWVEGKLLLCHVSLFV